MTDIDERGTGPRLRSGPMITAAALGAAGAMLLVAGIAVGSSQVLSTVRRWVRDMEVPPGERARRKWAQARVAAAAGATAWQDGSRARESAA